PDRDADGVADAVDACPDQPIEPERLGTGDGCPSVRVDAAAGKVSFEGTVTFEPGTARLTAEAGPLLDKIAVVLVAILAAIVWHTVTAILSVIGVERPGLESRRRETRPVSPEELEEAATRAADSGDLVTAVRRLYQAALRRIEIGRGKPWPRGLTDRDVLHRTARSPLHPPLSGFIDTLEQAWYADQPCTAADLEACRRHHGRIIEVVADGVLEPSRRSHPSPTAVEFSADALSP
ncbi:MAG: DUF4129 domain-containing protein, partial [Planctomycetia bacterium]